MSDMIILLDNGHGGIIDSTYQTEGKQSPLWDNGKQLFEGEFNRSIVNRLIEKLQLHNIKYVNITPEYTDIPLEERVYRANQYDPNNSLFISIHANAGMGSGFEAYTYYNASSKSHKFASIIYKEFKKEFPNFPIRVDYTDKFIEKSSHFYVLKYTKMPAILTENFFMDSYYECNEILLSPTMRDKIAKYHFNSILQYIF